MPPFKTILLIFACIVALPGRPHSAEPKAVRKVVYYDIQGETARELRRAMDTKGPKNEVGRRHDALTQWKITWTFQWQTVSGQLKIQTPQVTTDMVLYMPRWSPPENVDPTLTNRWQTFYKALSDHEAEHAKLVVAAGKEIQKKLESLPLQPTREALLAAINDVGTAGLTQLQKDEKELDQQTGHGTKTGAKFP